MSPSRPLYRPSDLSRLFAPRSIAVVGVSTNPRTFGSITWANLAGADRYEGQLYPVNGKYAAIGDQVCYPSVSALPEVPDCVFVAVPREATAGVVEECARLGVGGVVLFASGYAETRLMERVEAQQQLVAIARSADMRLLGPNCVGFMNYGLRLVGTFGTASYKGPPRGPAIGLVSQSGAVGAALAQAQEHGLQLSHLLTSGNASDVDAADQVAYLAADPSCSAVACLFEGMADPARFMEAAALCRAADKPLVVHKLGTSVRGAQAAVSHTGSIAGSHAAYAAAFERAGAVLVDEIEALLDTASFLAKAPAPKSRGVAVAAVSGGACILLADQAEKAGIDLPAPSAPTMAVLERLIPEYGEAGNPCDMTGQVLSTPEHLAECFEALMADPNYGALVVPHTFAYAAATARIAAMGHAAKEHGKAACAIWLTQHLEGPGAIEAEQNPHVAVFRSVRHCMNALKLWHRLADRQSGEAAHARLSPATARNTAAELIRHSSNATLTEREAKTVLAAYGVPVVRDTLVRNVEDAVRAAIDIGFPVALKVESPDIPHKTEAGVIRVDLGTVDEVREAFAQIIDNAKRVTNIERINGVLVQPMVPQGVEIMIGARIDPQFGPTIVVGLGGIFVELLQDVSVRLAPVSITEAHRMLSDLRTQAMLQGFRGAAPVDVDKLAAIVTRVSEFADDQRELIAEVDINPLICAGDRIIAVDALISRAS